MAWQETSVLLVRSLVNDFSDNPSYTDERIQLCFCLAGLLVVNELPFIANYTFDIAGPAISPDFTLLGDSYDQMALALFSLKAACILTVNSFQGALSNGIIVKDGDSQISTVGSLKNYSEILKLGPCKMYEIALKKAQFQGGANIKHMGHVITSPCSNTPPGSSMSNNSFLAVFDWVLR